MHKRELIEKNRQLQALVDQREQSDTLFLQTINDLKEKFNELGIDPLINLNIPLEAYIMSIQQPNIPEGWETWKNAWLDVVVDTALREQEKQDSAPLTLE